MKSDVKKSSEPEASLCTNEVETLISTSLSPPAAPSIAPLPSQAETSTVDRNSVPHLPSESVNVASIENQTILAQDMTQGVSISKNSRPSEFSHTPVVLCDPSQSSAPYYSSSNTSSEKKVEAVYAVSHRSLFAHDMILQARDFLTQIDDLRQSSNEVPTVRRKRDREPSTALETSDPMINQESSSIFPSPQYVLLTRYVIRRRQV